MGLELEYIDVNGYGVLVDPRGEIKEGDFVYDSYSVNTAPRIAKVKSFTNALYQFEEGTSRLRPSLHKIIFAERELNLDVPILPNWREWEIQKIAAIAEEKEYADADPHDPCGYGGVDFSEGFIAGYNHNKAKYTEEDLRLAITGAWVLGQSERNNLTESMNDIIRSLQKVPKLIRMETEPMNLDQIRERDKGFLTGDTRKLKLISRPGCRTCGIIEEIIY
jgi:hypothetical protein